MPYSVKSKSLYSTVLENPPPRILCPIRRYQLLLQLGVEELILGLSVERFRKAFLPRGSRLDLPTGAARSGGGQGQAAAGVGVAAYLEQMGAIERSPQGRG